MLTMSELDSLIDDVEEKYGEDSDSYCGLAYEFQQLVEDFRSVELMANKLLEE